MENAEIKHRTLGTHDGSFHADEVTACALLLLFDLIDMEGIAHEIKNYLPGVNTFAMLVEYMIHLSSVLITISLIIMEALVVLE